LKKKRQVWTFNGATSIKAKVGAAIDQGAGASRGLAIVLLFERLRDSRSSCSGRHDLGSRSGLQVGSRKTFHVIISARVAAISL
jgi:hypothetical protein